MKRECDFRLPLVSRGDQYRGARFPSSHEGLPSPGVSCIHSFIVGVFAVSPFIDSVPMVPRDQADRSAVIFSWLCPGRFRARSSIASWEGAQERCGMAWGSEEENRRDERNWGGEGHNDFTARATSSSLMVFRPACTANLFASLTRCAM